MIKSSKKIISKQLNSSSITNSKSSQSQQKLSRFLTYLRSACNPLNYKEIIKQLQNIGEYYLTDNPKASNIAGPSKAITCYVTALNLLPDEAKKDRFEIVRNIHNSRIKALELYKEILSDKQEISKRIEIEKEDLSTESKNLKGQIKKDQETLKEIISYTKTVENGLKNLSYNNQNQKKYEKVFHAFELIRKKLNEFMKTLVIECIKILGEPPCHFEIDTFGSASTGAPTPFSDIEMCILLDNTDDNPDKFKPYFRVLTRLIQERIINLGYTRIRGSRTEMPEFDIFFSDVRSEGLPFDKTSKGLTFDPGAKVPLGKPGKYELIGTPAELGEYILVRSTHCERDFKDIDRNLPKILITAAPLYQSSSKNLNKALLEECKNKLNLKFPIPKEISTPMAFNESTTQDKWQEIISKFNLSKHESKNEKLHIIRGWAQLRDIGNIFMPDFRFINNPGKIISVKKFMYRILTLYIESLCLFYGEFSGSYLDKLLFLSEESNKQNSPKLFNQKQLNQLKTCLAISYEARLVAYIKAGEQRDVLTSDMMESEKIDTYKQTLSKAELSTLFIFYKTIFPYIQAIRFSSHLGLNIGSNLTYFMKNLISEPISEEIKEKLKIQIHALNQNFQHSLLYLEEPQPYAKDFTSNSLLKAQVLTEAGLFQEALDWIEFVEFNSGIFHDPKKFISLLSIKTVNQLRLGRSDLALETMNIIKKIEPDLSIHSAGYYSNNSEILYELGMFKLAVDHAKKALKIFESQPNTEHDQCKVLNKIALCYSEIKEYIKAMQYAEKSCQLRRKIFKDTSIKVLVGMDNKAILHRKIGDISTCIQIQKNIWTTILKNPSQYGSKITTFFNTYTESLYLNGQLDEAKKCVENIKDEIFKLKPIDIAKWAYLTGQLLMKLELKKHEEKPKKFELAKQKFRLCLTQCKLTPIYSTLLLSSTYYFLAEIGFENNNIKESIQYIESSLKKLIDPTLIDSQDSVSIFNKNAHLIKKILGSGKVAFNSISQILNIFNLIISYPLIRYTPTYYLLLINTAFIAGYAYKLFGKFNETIKTYQNTIKLIKNVPSLATNAAILTGNLAGVYVDTGQYIAAINTFKNAIAYAKNAIKPDSGIIESLEKEKNKIIESLNLIYELQRGFDSLSEKNIE